MSCDNQTNSVPFIVHESTKAAFERTIRRLWILILVLVILLCGTNFAWIYYESQWEVAESTEVTQEINTSEGSAYVAGIGDVGYGQDTSNSSKN